MEGHLGHGPAREATVAAAHHPDIQVPPDKGTWFQQTARRVHHLGLRLGSRETARQAARSSGLLPPLTPAQPTGTSPSPPRLQGAAWHRSRPECCSAVCARVTSGHADEGGHRLPGGHPSGPRGSSLGSGRGLVLTPDCQEKPVGVGPDPGFWRRGFVHSRRSFPASVPPAEVSEFIPGDARRPAAPRSRR